MPFGFPTITESACQTVITVQSRASLQMTLARETATLNRRGLFMKPMPWPVRFASDATVEMMVTRDSWPCPPMSELANVTRAACLIVVDGPDPDVPQAP